MTSKTETRLRPAEVIEKYGGCLELAPMDKYFHDISVGLYVKDGVSTVWSYSRREGVEERLRAIRDQMVVLGGMAPVEGVSNQLRFDCGELHPRTLRFLIAQAVGKAPDYAPPGGAMSIGDSKSALTIHVEDAGDPERNVYRVSLEGEANNAALRLRMVLAGFVRYGEMEQVGDSGVSFSCGRKHDALIRILLPYSRNISSVETMMAAEAMRGQMTTNTLGFSQV